MECAFAKKVKERLQYLDNMHKNNASNNNAPTRATKKQSQSKMTFPQLLMQLRYTTSKLLDAISS